jgi:beta-lactamase regulating signal transducer with metallopeptidase domain
MAFLVDLALANLIVAVMLALVAAMAGLWGRRPALTHALWLLVLLKLITPPLFHCPIPWPTTPRPAPQERVAQVEPLPGVGELPVKAEEPTAPDPVLPFEEHIAPPDALTPKAGGGVPAIPPEIAQPFAPVERRSALPVQVPADAMDPVEEAAQGWIWPNVMLFAWLAGSCLWLTLALYRLWRLHRCLRFAQPAPALVQELARGLAGTLLVRCPEVCVIHANVSPMLWTLGRSPRLLLPAGLLERLSADQLTTLLGHELAHWRRRDDRIRWLELVVLALYWWCPLVWWARRELNQAEEECCDAWVVSILPDSAKAYALALVETVDFLSGAPALPVLASGLGRVRLLKRRITMILQGKTPRALTGAGLLSVAGVGLLLLPLVFSRAQNVQATAQPDETKIDRPGKKDRPADPKELLEKARMDVERLQEDLSIREQELQRELQQRMEKLQKAMQRLKQMERARQGNPGVPGGRPGGGPPGGFPGGPGGGPPGGPGGGAGGPGGFSGQPPGANLEQRLHQVEQKLDTLLQELRGLRNDMKKGPKGPFGGGGIRPGDPNNSPPPAGGGGRPGGPINLPTPVGNPREGNLDPDDPTQPGRPPVNPAPGGERRP